MSQCTHKIWLSTLLALCVVGLMAQREAHAQQTHTRQQVVPIQQLSGNQLGVKQQAFGRGGGGDWSGFGYAIVAGGLGPIFITSMVGLIGNAAFIGRNMPVARQGKRTWGIYGIVTGASLMVASIMPFVFGSDGRNIGFPIIGVISVSVGAATLGMGIANLVQSKRKQRKLTRTMLPQGQFLALN